MLRAAFALAASLALGAALPRLALADDTMCSVRGVASAPGALGSGVLVSVAPGEAVAIEASWLPGVPVFGAMSRAPVAAPAAGPDASEILWCASADDPRCAPADSDAGGSPRLGDGTLHWVVLARAPRVAASPSTSLRDAATSGGPLGGVARSLERPPR
jgi:hypothetical protein